MTTWKRFMSAFMRSLWHWANGLSVIATFAAIFLTLNPEKMSAVPAWVWMAVFALSVFFIAINTAKRTVDSYIQRSPELLGRYKLWELYRLLAEARDEARRGGFSDTKAREWNADVEDHLREWHQHLLDEYRLNLDDRSTLENRVRALEEVLDRVATGDFTF